jgi:hypothetical protein
VFNKLARKTLADILPAESVERIVKFAEQWKASSQIDPWTKWPNYACAKDEVSELHRLASTLATKLAACQLAPVLGVYGSIGPDGRHDPIPHGWHPPMPAPDTLDSTGPERLVSELKVLAKLSKNVLERMTSGGTVQLTLPRAISEVHRDQPMVALVLRELVKAGLKITDSDGGKAATAITAALAGVELEIDSARGRIQYWRDRSKAPAKRKRK